jgi:thymidylate synthase
MMLEYEYPGEAAVTVPKIVHAGGEVIAPRGQLTFELLNVHIVIKQPWHIPFDIPGRGLNHDISRLEIASLCGQQSVDSAQRSLVGALAGFQDDGVQWGNYGARIRGNLSAVLDSLKSRGSRQAVLTIFDANRDLRANTVDVPCTLSIQFFIRNDRLTTTVHMRSNDVYLGLPYDLHQFCILHCMVAQLMDVEAGGYHHFVGSLHAYERDENKIGRLGLIYETLDDHPWKFAADNLRNITMFLQDAVDERHLADARGDTPFERWFASWGS